MGVNFAQETVKAHCQLVLWAMGSKTKRYYPLFLERSAWLRAKLAQRLRDYHDVEEHPEQPGSFSFTGDPLETLTIYRREQPDIIALL